jgi:hypothetical protein
MAGHNVTMVHYQRTRCPALLLVVLAAGTFVEGVGQPQCHPHGIITVSLKL